MIQIWILAVQLQVSSFVFDLQNVGWCCFVHISLNLVMTLNQASASSDLPWPAFQNVFVWKPADSLVKYWVLNTKHQGPSPTGFTNFEAPLSISSRGLRRGSLADFPCPFCTLSISRHFLRTLPMGIYPQFIALSKAYGGPIVCNTNKQTSMEGATNPYVDITREMIFFMCKY